MNINTSESFTTNTAKWLATIILGGASNSTVQKNRALTALHLAKWGVLIHYPVLSWCGPLDGFRIILIPFRARYGLSSRGYASTDHVANMFAGLWELIPTTHIHRGFLLLQYFLCISHRYLPVADYPSTRDVLMSR